jgi:hypothetical protein
MGISFFGYEDSIRCRDCWLAYYNERQALFKLKPGAVWEAFRRV